MENTESSTRNKGVIRFSLTEKCLKIEMWRSWYCFRVHAWQIYIWNFVTKAFFFFFFVSTLRNKKVPRINAHYNQMFDQPVSISRGSLTRPSFLAGEMNWIIWYFFNKIHWKAFKGPPHIGKFPKKGNDSL